MNTLMRIIEAIVMLSAMVFAVLSMLGAVEQENFTHAVVIAIWIRLINYTAMEVR
jgi:hypothetical protein